MYIKNTNFTVVKFKVNRIDIYNYHIANIICKQILYLTII